MRKEKEIDRILVDCFNFIQLYNFGGDRTELINKRIYNILIKRNKREMKKKLIEIPTELFEKIQELAKKNERSDNKQIVYLLKKALEEK